MNVNNDERMIEVAKYYGTFSCGHEGVVQIFGPLKHREWKKDNEFSKLCPDCYEKFLQEQREMENKKSLEASKEMGLPELTGTEKQVKWANTLRQKLISSFEHEIEQVENDEYWDPPFTVEELRMVLDYVLKEKISSSYFIDRRFHSVIDICDLEIKNAKDAFDPEIQKEKELMLEIKAECTVYPEDNVTNGVVEIEINDTKVSALFEKNDEFREIVRGLGFEWNGVWEKKIVETTGTAEERAAELGNKLLNAGFPICIYDEKVRNRAIHGEFEPECKRWIYMYKGEALSIKWSGFDSSLYQKARSLPSSKWMDSSMVVKIDHYKLVEEFAELYGFKFTRKAQELIEAHKKSIEKSLIISPVKVDDKEKDGLKDILNSEVEILDDLKD